MNVLQEFNDTDYHPDYGMPWAPWFGFSYIRPLWGYYAPFTFGRWDMYVPAGKYNPVSEYVYGNNLVSRSDYDEKYAWSGRFTGTEYYTTDILGSVMLTTDSLRRVSNRYNYDAYGTNYTGSFSGKNKIGYNSKHYDTGTGWYNYGYRDYNPKLARFTTKDPIRDGSNWFAYCNGDPVNFVDLWGLEDRDRYGNWHSSSDESYKITGRWVLVGDFKEVYDQTPVGTNYPHNGKDYQWRNNAGQNETTGKTVTAQVDGKVIATGYDANVKGNYVRTQDDSGVITDYYHLDSVNDIKVGDNLKVGDELGKAGNTGASTGPHLHMDQYTTTKPSDYDSNPQKYLAKSYDGGNTYVYFMNPPDYSENNGKKGK